MMKDLLQRTSENTSCAKNPTICVSHYRVQNLDHGWPAAQTQGLYVSVSLYRGPVSLGTGPGTEWWWVMWHNQRQNKRKKNMHTTTFECDSTGVSQISIKQEKKNFNKKRSLYSLFYPQEQTQKPNMAWSHGQITMQRVLNNSGPREVVQVARG